MEHIDGKIVELAVGEYHMLARTDDGRLYSWGKHRAGQLGHDNKLKGFANPVEGLEGVRSVGISCGRQHSVAVADDGTVYSWGYGHDGALGHASRQDEKRPRKVDALSAERVIQVACGRDHTLLLTADGRVFGTGSDGSGQLGQGFADRYQRAPVPLRTLAGKKVVKVAAGESHSVAVTDEGRVFAWGMNSHGQLGHGDRSDVGIPRQVEALKGVVVRDVAAGGGHTLVVSEDGRVFAFGRGRNGQLGRGDSLESVAAYRTTPVEVERLRSRRVLGISAGSEHSLALVAKDT